MAPSTIPDFPARLEVELSDFERQLFSFLKERFPDKSDEELGRGVVARGLAVVVEEEKRKRGRVVTGGARRPKRLVSASARVKLFPSHFTLNLDEHERSDLEELYDLEPDLRDEVALMHKAICAGIHALQQAARKRDPTQLTRTEMEASNRSASRKARRGGTDPSAGTPQLSPRTSSARRRRIRRAAMLDVICGSRR